MDFNAQLIGIFVRVIAILSLALGLMDAARLLGVNMGATSPLAVLGPIGFVYLGIFASARLFASVGLWIKASWGGALLVGSTIIELALFLMGTPDVYISGFGFAMRLFLLASILVIYILSIRARWDRAAD
jgi:hypothetical protein